MKVETINLLEYVISATATAATTARHKKIQMAISRQSATGEPPGFETTVSFRDFLDLENALKYQLNMNTRS